LDIKRGFWSNRALALVESLGDELVAEKSDRLSGYISDSDSLSILIYVPSSAHALGKKKFDHMEQCLKQIEKSCENFFVLVSGVVQINKSRLKESQHNLNKKERIQNNKDKFYLHVNFINYLYSLGPRRVHIYCIDDITTTGSTFDSVANLIHKELPRTLITCIAIAR
jgi:predicted amidophosphoribosyltransferase